MRTQEEIKKCVEELLSRMTLEEKIGQMVQSAGNDTSAIGGDVDALPLEGQIEQGLVGSVIYINDNAAQARKWQKLAVEKSRLGIPLLFCQDVIHGFQTVFPIPLGWSCSFDPDLIHQAAEVSAKEATRAGVMLTFSPMLDIARDPRWGRMSEGAGEDPYLDGQIARALVTGYQGGDTGHGCRTYLRLSDIGGADMRCRLFDAHGERGVEIALGGDAELHTLLEALEFVIHVLKDQIEEARKYGHTVS